MARDRSVNSYSATTTEEATAEMLQRNMYKYSLDDTIHKGYDLVLLA